MFNRYSTQTLQLIIRSKNLKELASHFENTVHFDKLLSFAQHNGDEEKMVSFAQTLDASLKLFVWPMNTFLLGSATLQMMLASVFMLPLTFGALAVGVGLFIWGAIKSSKELDKQKKQVKDFFQLSDLKLKAYAALIERKLAAIWTLNPNVTSKVLHAPVKTFKNKKLILFFSSVYAAIMPLVTIASAAVTVGSILQILGYLSLATFVATPIGMGVLAGIGLLALGLALFVGIKHYSASQNKKRVETKMTNKEFELKNFEAEYVRLEKIHQNLITQKIAENNAAPVDDLSVLGKVTKNLQVELVDLMERTDGPTRFNLYIDPLLERNDQAEVEMQGNRATNA